MRVVAILMLILLLVPIIVNTVSSGKGQHRKGRRYYEHKRNNTVHSSASLSQLDFATKEDDQGTSLEWRPYRSKEGTGENQEEE